MTNTSASGGYLVPSTTAPADDDALEDTLHDALAGITGLAAASVRPKWQQRPATRPEASTDWAAFAVTISEADWSSSIVHDPAGDGNDVETRYTTLDLLVTFYGPNAGGNAEKLRDGISIPQNMEALAAQGLEILDTGPIITAPEFINTVWIRRKDVTLRLRRAVSRTYPVRNLLSAGGELTTDVGNTNVWSTEN
jgi:hypothetical protein